MKIIALDSSGLVASVAITENDTLIAEYSIQYKKTHSQTLLPMLAEITKMAELDLSTVDAIALAAGPGSFTGLRIGSATAKGLGFALAKPLVEVPTVDGLAYNLYGTDKLVCPLMDARRNQVYTGVYEFVKVSGKNRETEEKTKVKEITELDSVKETAGNKEISEAGRSDDLTKNDTGVIYRMDVTYPQCAVAIEDIAATLNKMHREVIFLGDGVPVFAARLKELMEIPYSFAPAHMNRQRAAALAALAMNYLAEGKTVTAARHAPVYLRLSQAEREKATQVPLTAASGQQTGKIPSPGSVALPVTVRLMAPQDVAAVSAIEARTFSQPWKADDFLAMISAADAYYYVAELDGHPVGACGLQNVVGEGQITNVLVAEEYRRRGIARKLMEDMLAAGNQAGMTSYVLEVRASNQPAINLYESLGFKTVGRRRDFYEKPTEDGLIMEKSFAQLLIKTDRLFITTFNESMIEVVHKNSLDQDNRKFVPDEVFETVEKAGEIVRQCMAWYQKEKMPLVYPIILNNGDNIGYVQAVPPNDRDWEIGYHIAEKYTGKGYATEAVKAFLPVIMERLSLEKMAGVCLAENLASCRVMEKNGFVLEYKGQGEYQGEPRDICRYQYRVE